VIHEGIDGRAGKILVGENVHVTLRGNLLGVQRDRVVWMQDQFFDLIMRPRVTIS
jgi:hypothetical protein